MGLVKTIYNVLGGFYMDYNSTNATVSVHKLNKRLHVFLCTFSSPKFIISNFKQNMHKKTEFFRLGFVFVNFRNFFYLKIYTFSTVFSSKRASNSSLEIFSFSKRSSAQASSTSRCSKIMRFASAYALSMIVFTSLSIVAATPSL